MIKQLALIQLLLWTLVTSVTQADTYTVNTTVDSIAACAATCSLRAAILAANSTTAADTIEIHAGTYTLTRSGANEDLASTGDLDITEDVTITGAGSATTIIDGDASDRVFHIMSGATVIIENVTIRNGQVSDENGGGILNNGTLSLTGSIITSNVTDTHVPGGGGGGIYNLGLLTIENCSFTSNQAIDSVGASTTPNPTSIFPGGGAIQNEGTSGFGANTTTTTIIGTTFQNNNSSIGGAIRNLFGRVFLDLSTVEDNTADLSGGGVVNGSNGSMTINRSVIRNNIAPQSGGGIDNVGALDILQSTINGNQTLGISPTVGGAGGGVFNSGNGAINLANSTISANEAVIGGGLYNHRDVLSTNATIYDNVASIAGSEVYACGNKDENAIPPQDCDSGITDTNGNQVINTRFVNTIVGNSTTVTNCDGYAPLIISNGHNIETANTCGFTATGDKRNITPASLFTTGLLEYNGGDVAALLTYAIKSGGPAHDAGDLSSCPVIDERGFKRNDEDDGKCDIGAYEISSTNTGFAVLDLALDIQSRNNDPIGGTVQTTINFTVVNKGPLQANNVILTGHIPALSWLNISSLTSGTAGGSCSSAGQGIYNFTCTIPSIAAYQTAEFNMAVIASQAGSYIVDANVDSDGTDNFRPDNLKTLTIEIDSITNGGGGISGGFSGSGGGAIDWLSLVILGVPALRRLRRR